MSTTTEARAVAPRRHRPLAPNGAAERAALRTQLAPEARRLALAQWWAGIPKRMRAVSVDPPR